MTLLLTILFGGLRSIMFFVEMLRRSRFISQGKKENALEALLVQSERIQRALAARRAPKGPIENDPHNRA